MISRYFKVIGGPMLEAFREIVERRRTSAVALRAFLEKTGASQVYGTSPKTYQFDFPAKLLNAGKLDAETWSKTKPRRGSYYFVPRKNTVKGKAMAAEIAKLPECPSFGSVLALIPDLPLHFAVTDGNSAYSPFIRFAQGSTIIVSVPWDDTVTEKELAAYKKQARSKSRREYSRRLDFAQWTPPEWMSEIKEWQALKIIDEAKK